ncbi:MAG: hypothetical protein OEW15_11985 [Nitrospirota bacterium]|nr:hypothetical protein [Nitrospirota bacterium]
MKIALLSTIAAVPLIGESLLLRMLLFIPCWITVGVLVRKWLRAWPVVESGHNSPTQMAAIPIREKDRSLQQMIDQLKQVIQQTEQASLAINERFMNIAGRARRQLQTTREIIDKQERNARTAAGANAHVTTLLDAVTLETNMLAGDINAIIESLQFQDITRQHIEQVIGQIEDLLREIDTIKQRSREPGFGPQRPGEAERNDAANNG